MVFRIQTVLAEEDRAAWRRLVVRWDRAAVKKHHAAVIGRVLDKLNAWSLMLGAAAMLAGILSGGISAWMTPDALLLLLAGVLILSFCKPPEIKPPVRLPEQDLPPSDAPDAPVRAVFFEDGCFAFWDARGKVRLGYRAISCAWEDEGRFYLFFADRPPLVLPKRGLGRRMPEDFREFLERELGAPVERVG